MRADANDTGSTLAWPWWLGLGYLLGLLLAAGGFYSWMIWAKNLHALIPGQVYRAGQVNEALLTDAVQRLGVRTLINLRGGNPELAWYQQECAAAHKLNLSLIDIHLSAYRLPPASELRRLVQVLDQCEFPVLIHCKHGADRTGLISALILLLHTDTPLDEAERQSGPAFGRVSLGPTANLDEFYQLYRAWLASKGMTHSRSAFRRWLEQEYSANGWRAELHWLDASAPAPVGRPFGVQVRAVNGSSMEWQFRAGETAGCHALYYLTDDAGRPIQVGRAALRDTQVAPGGSIDFTIPLESLTRAGRYHLLVDLEDGRRGMFFQFGSRPILRTLMAVQAP